MKRMTPLLALVAILGFSLPTQAAELISPLTGDTTNPTLYIVLAVVAVAAIIIAIFGIRRARSKKSS